MIKLYFVLNLFRLLPAYLTISISKNKSWIWADIERYCCLDKLNGGRFYVFGLLVLRKPEIRNQIINRLKQTSRVQAALFRMLFKPLVTLYINTSQIGEGLYIQHGFSTIISAKSIGKNCFINQQVTIGYEGDKSPVIGDNVRICAGAKVIGGVHVGDGAIIGANAVVVKDIPSNTTAGGVPAKVIRWHEDSPKTSDIDSVSN